MNVGTGLSPGTVLAGRYEIQSEIGRGERSIVFEALDTQRDRRVAVKLLSPLAAIAHLMREQLRRYSDELASVQHAGILKPIELLEAGLETLIVMEQAEGSDPREPGRCTGSAQPARGRGDRSLRGGGARGRTRPGSAAPGREAVERVAAGSGRAAVDRLWLLEPRRPRGAPGGPETGQQHRVPVSPSCCRGATPTRARTSTRSG